MMRLRLRIERNALPATQALWPVKDSKCTIAQLLQHINDTFPLEADTWGLEDYTVSVGGYDCLHYHEVRAVCKDEDEVVIKPLQYVDVRSRALTGRDQIAADGRHLVDGVPFGRPALRAPVRPEITIPPRKKKRNLLGDVADEHSGEVNGQLMLTEHGEDIGGHEDEDEDEEDDEDFGSPSSSSEDTENVDGSDESSCNTSSEDSSDSEAEDTSDSESEHEESWNGIPSSQPPTPSRQAQTSALPNGVHDTNETSADATTGAKRKRQSDDANDDVVEQVTNSKVPKVSGLPFQGKPETKKRNERRRDTKKLKHLKAIGALPKDATLETLHRHEEERKQVKNAEFQAKRVQLLSDIQSGGVDVTSKRARNAREKLLLEATAPGAEATSDQEGDNEEPLEMSSRLPPTPIYSAPAKDSTEDETAGTTVSSTTPRARLDLAGSKRLVFGSLGVRVPKTQEEKDALQKKLADRPRRNVQFTLADAPEANRTAPMNVDVQDELDNQDEESWRDKINLTAVECCDEGVTLNAPPFPFHQRWDPQYKKKKAKKRVNSTFTDGSNGKKRQRGNHEQGYVETYDKYNVNGGGDELNYDDAEDDEYWEEGALLNGESEDGDDEEHAGGNQGGDGFPTLPANVEELPVVAEKDILPNDFITWNDLACDDSTGWQPKQVARTAQVLGYKPYPPTGELDCDLQLSKRDIKPKVFDQDGNRVYSKFEMPDEDEPDDDGKLSMLWKEFGTVRLVLRPEAPGVDAV